MISSRIQFKSCRARWLISDVRIQHFSSDFQDNNEDEQFYGKPRAASSSGLSGGLQQQLRGYTSRNRIAIAIHNATTAYSDPTRADAVAVLGEITGHITLRRIHDKMIRDPTGRRILQDRPIVSKATIPYEKLIAESNNISRNDDDLTFGQAYGSFLNVHGFDPDERDGVNFVEDETLAYIMLRYRQCHDYFHAITGLPPTVLGELGLKWFELFRTGLPVAALSCTVGSLRLNDDEKRILHGEYLPWAMQQQHDDDGVSRGEDFSSSTSSSSFLMNVYYEKEFNTPIKELRKRLNIQPIGIPRSETGL